MSIEYDEEDRCIRVDDVAAVSYTHLVDTSGFPDLFAVQRLEDGHPFIASFDNSCHMNCTIFKTCVFLSAVI